MNQPGRETEVGGNIVFSETPWPSIQLEDAGVSVYDDTQSEGIEVSVGKDKGKDESTSAAAEAGDAREQTRQSDMYGSYFHGIGPIPMKLSSRKNCFVSAVVSFCFVVVALGVMVGLLVNSSNVPTMQAVDEPWHDPFLPPYTKPVSYEVWLHPDFYHSSSTFIGRENITISILRETNTLLVHCKEMEITDVQVMLSTGESLEVVTHFMFPSNQYLVVQTRETMSNGATVILHVEFDGSLYGINGYYKSKYVNRLTGKER